MSAMPHVGLAPACQQLAMLAQLDSSQALLHLAFLCYEPSDHPQSCLHAFTKAERPFNAQQDLGDYK